jgi:hypothetical protein
VPSITISPGPFDLGRVPPGRYYLSAQSTTPVVRAVVQTIEVSDRDLDDIRLKLLPTVTVKGQVTIDGQPPSGPGAPVFFQLLAGPGRTGYSATPVQPSGAFTIENVSPGEYRYRVIMQGEWPWVQSADFAGQDVTDAPIAIDGDPADRVIQLRLSLKTATIDALVLDADSKPLVGVAVTAVPDVMLRNRSSLFRGGVTDATGHTRLAGLPPGRYTVLASDQFDSEAWQDPDLLRQYDTRGQRIQIEEGTTRALTLRLVR